MQKVGNKARLVAQDHSQEEGIDDEEVFAPVARIEATLLFLAYASFMGFMVYQMDIKSAFLYGTIEEEVYVYQPLGFKDLDYPNKVYKSIKALYGLHQAPKTWYETLASYLLENGFQRGKIDQTLFIKKQKGDILMVKVYVDDIIFRSTNKDLCKAFEKFMKNKFQMSSMGELTFFLGLQVKQKPDGIFISQDKYVAKILRKFGLTDRKSASTPIDTEKPLLKDPDGEDVDVHAYRSMISSLMYLTSSRPDIMYLKGKPHLGLWYPKDLPFNLVAYFDSDYAGASLNKKSTTGGYQFLGCRLISWQCKKQTIVATSSTEAEYVAAASYYAQVLWIQNQLLDCGNEALAILGQTATVDVKDGIKVSAVDLKKMNDVVRLQALIDRKKLLITEDSIRQALRLNDADSVDCLPNEEIFAKSARMGYGSLLPKDAAEDKDVVNEVSDEPTSPLPTPANPPPPQQEHIPSPPQAETAQPSPLPQQQHSQPAAISMTLLNTLLETCATLTKQVANLEQDKIDQAIEITKLKQRVKRGCIQTGGIVELDADEDVTLEEVDAEVTKDADETNTAEPTEVEEVIKVVTAAKLMTKVVTTSIIAAPVPKVSAPRRITGVIIQDPEEAVTTSEKQVKRNERQDNTVMRYQALKRKPVTETQARKNIMVYLKNMVGFKMDFFKEELKTHLQIVLNDEDDVYTEATPLALKVPVVDYQIYHEHNKPFYKIIIADGTHQLFLSFITLLRSFDREDLEMLWKLVQERFQSSEPKNFSDDFLLSTFKIMFEKPNVEASIWRDQRGRYGLAKFKSWKLFESCGLHIITYTTTQIILPVERKYPLTRFTLEQMLNNARLEVEEESEMSLELLRLLTPYIGLKDKDLQESKDPQFFTPISFAILNLAIKASYSPLLLVASNLNLRAWVNSSPSGFVSISPASVSSAQDDPSVNKIHISGSSFSTSMAVSGSSSFRRSTMKSAMICPLTNTLGLECMAYSPNSILHFCSLPATSGLDNTCLMGWSVTTIIECAWKYLFKRLLACTIIKSALMASFAAASLGLFDLVNVIFLCVFFSVLKNVLPGRRTSFPYVQPVFCYVPWDTGYVCGLPREHIQVTLEISCIFLTLGLPMIPLYGDDDLTTTKFIQAEVECSSSPLFTSSDNFPNGRFMHGITNPELIKRLHDKIPKLVDEMMRITSSFLRVEVAAGNQERKKSLSPWKQHEAEHKQSFKKGGFKISKGQSGDKIGLFEVIVAIYGFRREVIKPYAGGSDLEVIFWILTSVICFDMTWNADPFWEIKIMNAGSERIGFRTYP
uniref:Putative ribonuclease H-like domain-containing protein n=1 Tax=Tanacetum cinerariifolium TaxID=118510 RepID=A0A699HQJ0_TANCI|nr:putative ribonuclease H-like domain-containing protein [Tanacetum cinerariifolium]